MDMTMDQIVRSPLFAKVLMDKIAQMPTFSSENAIGPLVDRDDILRLIAEWAKAYTEPINYWEKIKVGQFPAWRCTGCWVTNYIEPPRKAHFCPGCGVMMKDEVEQ